MAISKRVFLVAAAAITFFTQRYAAWATLSKSTVWNTGILFVVAVAAQFCWASLVYPLMFSPLRHLPQPPVSSFIEHDFKSVELIVSECQSFDRKLVEDFQGT